MSEAITYTASGGRVTLEMSLQDLYRLTTILGYGLAGAQLTDQELFERFAEFMHRFQSPHVRFESQDIPQDWDRILNRIKTSKARPPKP